MQVSYRTATSRIPRRRMATPKRSVGDNRASPSRARPRVLCLSLASPRLAEPRQAMPSRAPPCGDEPAAGPGVPRARMSCKRTEDAITAAVWKNPPEIAFRKVNKSDAFWTAKCRVK
jgi:hypothetical protein